MIFSGNTHQRPCIARGCDTSGNIPSCEVALRRTCRCTEFHRVKNANLRHPSCTVVIKKCKSASPVLHRCNVKTQICLTRPQCVNTSDPTCYGHYCPITMRCTLVYNNGPTLISFPIHWIVTSSSVYEYREGYVYSNWSSL
jgi:hypothetical protein